MYNFSAPAADQELNFLFSTHPDDLHTTYVKVSLFLNTSSYLYIICNIKTILVYADSISITLSKLYHTMTNTFKHKEKMREKRKSKERERKKQSIRRQFAGGCICIRSCLMSSRIFRANRKTKLHYLLPEHANESHHGVRGN